ncbi:hypothetical protein HDU89_003226 [Geranomyces variabilis]|nr:hypothetical protein HDU89_003226 [Geranomyces variabilis]
MAFHNSPFGLPEEDIDNPFADSSTAANAGTAPSFNAYSSAYSTENPVFAQGSAPDVPSSFHSPQSGSSAQANASLSAREEELRKREAELNAREAALRREQDAMRAAGFKPPNFPKFYPLFHHDIPADIPASGQKTVTNIFRLWLATVALLIWNMVACLTLLVSHPSNLPNVASDFGVSLIYIFFIGSASLYLWYRPVYIAFQSNAALYFYLFLLFNGMHIAFCFYMAVGIPGSGGAGFINLLAVLSDGKIVATVFCIGATAGWVFSGIYSLWQWKEVHAHKSAGGHTLQSARNEAATMGVQSGVGQAAASAYIRSETGTFAA